MEMVHFIPPGQRRLALLAAQTDTAPVLISGASGTGKGAIARWIHHNGPRAGKPLVIANPNRLLKHQIAEAQAGSLIIAEIGEYTLSEQMSLLNYLKTKSVPHPENPNTPMLVNTRIIVTASQTLEGRAQGGLFNIELLEKLNVFRIDMPQLSRRADEFEDIVMGLVGEITREIHKEHLRELTKDAWKRLKGYDWPGNLRELRNVLRVAIITAKGDRLEAHDLPGFGHDRIDFRATRQQFEKIYIVELLKTFDWQIDKTCRMAKMDKETLLAKMAQYGIHPERPSTSLN